MVGGGPGVRFLVVCLVVCLYVCMRFTNVGLSGLFTTTVITVIIITITIAIAGTIPAAVLLRLLCRAVLFRASCLLACAYGYLCASVTEIEHAKLWIVVRTVKYQQYCGSAVEEA